MADQTSLPSKKDVTHELLLKGTVFVHLDPRRDDVAVPNWFKHQAQLVLQIGLDMPIPIPDLRVDGFGVFGTLSFNKSPFTCSVPWEAVFAVVGDNGKGMVWPDTMPPEIAAEVDRESRRQGIATVPPLRPKPQQAASLVEVEPSPESLRAPAVPAEAQPLADLAPEPGEDAASVAGRELDGGALDTPPTDLAARRELDRSGGRDSERPSSDSWRPKGGKKKVKLPPYLRVVK